ncbi:hypothetical protein ELQ90_00715 [Labedella phragmitis]|uniref:Uncharacterized protein n=1 Tax=Labedella phragmitis TaxID=2498849 RepID=A0A444PXC5_9MICO|nr:hypothetical protein [Labedella phragmitis]RWZ52514.1 hypothetical protein ELQ90_00715 [Labedella phragmitis]
MISEFVSSPVGAYVLSFVLAVAMGLVAAERGIRAWLTTVLVTIVFIAVASTRMTDAVFAAPLYVTTIGVTAILVTMVELRASPLLVSEPLWRKVLLVAVREGAVRAAAELDERDRATDSARDAQPEAARRRA